MMRRTMQKAVLAAGVAGLTSVSTAEAKPGLHNWVYAAGAQPVAGDVLEAGYEAMPERGTDANPAMCLDRPIGDLPSDPQKLIAEKARELNAWIFRVVKNGTDHPWAKTGTGPNFENLESSSVSILFPAHSDPTSIILEADRNPNDPSQVSARITSSAEYNHDSVYAGANNMFHAVPGSVPEWHGDFTIDGIEIDYKPAYADNRLSRRELSCSAAVVTGVMGHILNRAQGIVGDK